MTTALNMERFFKALADRTRLRLLNLMGDKEICVCYFVRVLRQSQPKISRHLAYLRRAGVVTARREGAWMHYRVAPLPNRDAASALRKIHSWCKHDPEMRRDLARLNRVCSSRKRRTTLPGAPLPAAVTCLCGPAKRQANHRRDSSGTANKREKRK